MLFWALNYQSSSTMTAQPSGRMDVCPSQSVLLTLWPPEHLAERALRSITLIHGSSRMKSAVKRSPWQHKSSSASQNSTQLQEDQHCSVINAVAITSCCCFSEDGLDGSFCLMKTGGGWYTRTERAGINESCVWVSYNGRNKVIRGAFMQRVFTN